MGFDVARFPDQQVPTHLRCLLCHLVLQEPQQTPDCNHNFCRVCIHNWLQSGSSICPAHEEDNISVKSDTKKKSPLRKMSIRKIIGKSSNKESAKEKQLPTLRAEDLKQVSTSLLDELNALRIRCDNFENGCKAVLHIIELSEHLKSCEHTSLKPLTVVSVNKMADNTSNNDLLDQEAQLLATVEQPTSQQKDVKPANAPETEPNTESIESEASKSRKDSCVSEDREEVGSDDFVVVHKLVSESRSSNGNESTGDNTSDKVGNETDDKTAMEKKKKKKKKKKMGGNKKEEETLSTNSQLDEHSSEEEDSNVLQKKLEQAEFDRIMLEIGKEILQLREEKKVDAQKIENLKSVNNQLIAQVKQLQSEREVAVSPPDESQRERLDRLEQQFQTLQSQNQLQAHRIEALTDINAQYHKLLISIRNQEQEAKDRFARTVSQFTFAVQSIRATSV